MATVSLLPRTPRPRRTRSGRASRATSAGAPATTTSSGGAGRGPGASRGGSDPGHFRLPAGRVGGRSPRPAGRGRRRRQAASRRSFAAPADEAAPGRARGPDRHRPSRRALLRPRRRRPDPRGRAHPPPRPGAVQLLASELPLLAHVAGQIGDPQVRHRGTIGGSLAHGDPASDLPAVVLALDATLVARGPSGSREIAAGEFFLGLFETALQPGELLTEIRIPKPRRRPAAGRSRSSPSAPSTGPSSASRCRAAAWPW